MILTLYDKFRRRPPASERVKAAMARPSRADEKLMAPFTAKQISEKSGVGRLRLHFILKSLEKEEIVVREKEWLFRLRKAR